jgi:uncharacterized protein YndB with AHSA1/START domain
MTTKFEIRKEVDVDATPEEVWQAISTGAGLAAWFQPAELGPDSDTVVTWEPPSQLVTQTPGEDGSTQAIEFLVEARAEGSTILRLVHGGFASDDWDEERTAEGWEMYLCTLARYFTHFAGRPAVYVEAEAPPSSAEPTAWPRILDALGLTEPVQPGAAVHLELHNNAPIDGVVDYVTANYIGLRTADALIRFHGRTPIGMTVAVSHHAYVEGFDAPAATRGWETWLAEAFA